MPEDEEDLEDEELSDEEELERFSEENYRKVVEWFVQRNGIGR